MFAGGYAEKNYEKNGASVSKVKILKQYQKIWWRICWNKIETNMEKNKNVLKKSAELKKNLV